MQVKTAESHEKAHKTQKGKSLSFSLPRFFGVRLPADERGREFVRARGGALTATSANPAGESLTRTAAEVASYFSEDLTLIVDGGRTVAEQPSTVVEVWGGEARLIREGAVARSELQARV